MSKKELIEIIARQELKTKLSSSTRKSVTNKQKQVRIQLKQQTLTEEMNCHKE